LVINNIKYKISLITLLPKQGLGKPPATLTILCPANRIETYLLLSCHGLTRVLGHHLMHFHLLQQQQVQADELRKKAPIHIGLVKNISETPFHSNHGFY